MLELTYYYYFDYYAKMYNINTPKLITIAYIESNLDHKKINKNKNGTYDYGLMQINSSWIRTLEKIFDEKITKHKLLRPDYNIKYGAYIYKYCIDKFGDNYKAIDCYNKGEKNASSNSYYVNKFKNNYKVIKVNYNQYKYYDAFSSDIKLKDIVNQKRVNTIF